MDQKVTSWTGSGDKVGPGAQNRRKWVTFWSLFGSIFGHFLGHFLGRNCLVHHSKLCQKYDQKSDQKVTKKWPKWSKSGQNRQKWAKTAILALWGTVFAVFTCKIVFLSQKTPKSSFFPFRPGFRKRNHFLVTFWSLFGSLFGPLFDHFWVTFWVGFPVYCKLNCVRNTTRNVTRKVTKKVTKNDQKTAHFWSKSRFFQHFVKSDQNRRKSTKIVENWPLFGWFLSTFWVIFWAFFGRFSGLLQVKLCQEYDQESDQKVTQKVTKNDQKVAIFDDFRSPGGLDQGFCWFSTIFDGFRQIPAILS